MSLSRRILTRYQAYKRIQPTPRRLEGIVYNDNPSIERIVFIGGLHRSGTTLLERLLSARYDVSYLRADVPESEGQHMQTVFSPAIFHGGPGRFAFSKEMRDELNVLTDFSSCRKKLLSEWGQFVVGTAPTLLEKSPPNLTKIKWLRKVFPNSRFVIMARDPRAASGATKKWSNTSLPELVAHWGAAYSQSIEDFDSGDCIIVRYEDVISFPNKEISRIANFLDLKERVSPERLEGRYREMKSSNEKYIRMHAGAKYGLGVWNNFGYQI